MKNGIHPEGYAVTSKRTNANRIRSMTDEELAEVLFGSCIEHMGVEECSHPEEACKSCVLDWLRAESVLRGGRTMGRLIDAGLFLDNLSGRLESMKDYDAVKDAINNMPTAYDPDKVVEQLEKLKSLVPVNRILDDIINDKPKELGMLIAYEKAIKIVKGGGVDA